MVTPPLSDSYLHGVTRDSTLTLAARMGYQVEERPVTVDEVVNWQGEAALSGTAAVLSGVGIVIHRVRKSRSMGAKSAPTHSACVRHSPTFRPAKQKTLLAGYGWSEGALDRIRTCAPGSGGQRSIP